MDRERHPTHEAREALRQQVLDPAVSPREEHVSFADQRDVIEEAVGVGLDRAFSRHAGSVVTDEEGRRHLSLSVEHDGRPATAELAQSVGDDGTRTADLTLMVDELAVDHWRYTDGPDGRRITPYTRDQATGELVPSKAGTHYDPTTDEEVVRWAKPWVSALYNGAPKRQRFRKILKFLGDGAVTGAV